MVQMVQAMAVVFMFWGVGWKRMERRAQEAMKPLD